MDIQYDGNWRFDILNGIQDEREDFRMLSWNLRLPHLQPLTLEWLDVYQDDLTMILGAHAGTVREIYLYEVGMCGSWWTVLTVMRDQLQQLTKLRMMCCRLTWQDGESDRDFIYFRDDSGTSSDSFEVVGRGPLLLSRLIRGLSERSGYGLYGNHPWRTWLTIAVVTRSTPEAELIAASQRKKDCSWY